VPAFSAAAASLPPNLLFYEYYDDNKKTKMKKESRSRIKFPNYTIIKPSWFASVLHQATKTEIWFDEPNMLTPLITATTLLAL
jgi:hypothetical protein